MARVSNLDSLLNQLDGDPSVKDGIRSLLKFGLVFEDSQPEVLRLRGGVVTVGCRVDDRSPNADRFGTVVRAPRGTDLGRGVRPVVWDDTPDEIDYVEERGLVPIAGPGEAVYPGLNVIDTVERGGEKPHHLAVQGENFHALQALRYTHAGKVDVIYIDPPYNTGGDFVYNDKYMQKEDAFRHSKWLSFMERRLRLGRELMSDTGVIIVAIDDNEQAHLRLLMDDIFGARNFIATMPTVMNLKGNQDQFAVAGTHEYHLIYAKRRDRTYASLLPLSEEEIESEWEEDEYGLFKRADTLRRTGKDAPRSRRPKGWFPVFITPDDFVYATADDTPLSDGDRMILPVSDEGEELSWSWGKKKIQEEPHNLVVTTRRNGEPNIYKKQRPGMGEVPGRKLKSVLYSAAYSSSTATLALKNVFGEKRFDNPKPVPMLKDLLSTFLPETGIVLDFFGGSGSTQHAVMEMNEADGGSRQCVLVTNNELDEKERRGLIKSGLLPGDEDFEARGIFRRVTYPRIKTVATGIREDGSEYSGGLQENVTFAEMTYTTRQSVRLGRDFAQIAPLLWAKAGARGEVLTATGPDFPQFLLSDSYGVVFDSGAGALAAFAVAAEKAGLPDGSHVFVVTDDDARFAHAHQRLTNFTVHRLYEDYLSNFEVRA